VPASGYSAHDCSQAIERVAAAELTHEIQLVVVAMDVHVLTLWKERVFGVIVACGAFATILAINIIKMLGLHSS
jgi:hypothetical protein